MTESSKLACEGCRNACADCGNDTADSTVHAKQRRTTRMNGIGWAAVALMAVWVVGIGHALQTGTVPWLTGLVLLWLIYNFIPWWVLRWRLLIISRRGNLLGFGYAFGAGIISALAAETGGFGGTLAMMGLNVLLLALPFVLPFALRFLPARPHWTDLLVAAYFVSFVWWWPLDTAVGAWENVRLAPFVAATSLVTYFIGVRYWNRTIWELNVRRRDVGLTLGILAALSAVLWWEHGGPSGLFADVLPFMYSFMVVGPLIATAVFGVIQPTLAQLIREVWESAAQPLAALLAAAVFMLLASLHDFSVGTVVAGLGAAGIIWRFERLFPALLVVSLYTAWLFSLGSSWLML